MEQIIKGNYLPISERYRIYSTWFLVLTVIFMVVSCSGSTGPDPENKPGKITKNKAVNTVVKVFEANGITFPPREKGENNIVTANNTVAANKTAVAFDLFLFDYLDVEVDKSEGVIDVIRIQIWIGPKGNVIPSLAWLKAHPKACIAQGRFIRAAVNLLGFKIFPATKEVQLNYIDVETSKIEESVMVAPSLSDPNWLINGIQSAWEKMQPRLKQPIKSTVSPCGERIPLKFHFNSSIKAISEGTGWIAAVETEFDLKYNKKEDYYYGSGVFHWKNLTLINYPGNCHVSNLQDAEPIKVKKFILPGMQKNVNKAKMVLFVDASPSDFSTVICIEHNIPVKVPVTYSVAFLPMHEDEVSAAAGGFVIKNWKKVDEPGGVFFEKEYDRTQTYGPNSTFTENTVMQVIVDVPKK